MKFTNVKQLIIKFMGGGLINFPTRFLRWVKINGDSDDSDDGGGGGSSSDVFFSPIPIQPSYLLTEYELLDITELTVNSLDEGYFLYSKESLVSIGVNEEALNNLEQVSYSDTFEQENESKSLHQNGLKDIILQNYLIDSIFIDDNDFIIRRFEFEHNRQYPVIFKVGENIYRIAIFEQPS